MNLCHWVRLGLLRLCLPLSFLIAVAIAPRLMLSEPRELWRLCKEMWRDPI